MKKFLNLKWAAVAGLALCLPMLSSCSDDDTRSDDDELSLYELQQELQKNWNDRMEDGLLGPVKTATYLYYRNVTLVDGVPKGGYIYNQQITEHNEKGNYSKQEYFWDFSPNQDGSQLRLNYESSYTYDSKDRLAEVIGYHYAYDSNGDNQTVRICYKYTFTYDESANTATITSYESADGVSYTEVAKYVYRLNQYGKIDRYNYEGYKNKATRADYGSQPDNKSVVKYDEKGNVVLSYYLNLDDSGEYQVNGYSETAYTYY